MATDLGAFPDGTAFFAGWLLGFLLIVGLGHALVWGAEQVRQGLL